MLDEVIEYLKQLQAHVEVMNRMGSFSPMMMPAMGMHPQFQMNMMTHMAHMAHMGPMGMGMGMMPADVLSLGRAGAGGLPLVMPAPAFLPMIGPGSWGLSSSVPTDRMQQPSGGPAAVMPDPFPPSLACPTQQQMTTMDAYQRMASMYQQMFQQTQPSNPK